MIHLGPHTIGKALETLGAFLLAYVGIRAAIIEIFIVHRLRNKNHNIKSQTDIIARNLEEIDVARRKEFGPYEAGIVAVGSVLVAVGCAIYLVAIASE